MPFLKPEIHVPRPIIFWKSIGSISEGVNLWGQKAKRNLPGAGCQGRRFGPESSRQTLETNI